MGVPQSRICVCNYVYLDNNYTHTIYFDNEYDQQEYFGRKVVKTFTAYSYIRRSWSLKVQATMAEAASWSYLFFRNNDNEKFYYYFITQIEYINDNTVELFLEMDVMQTYHFQMNLKRCFIERQHTESDNLGEHTIDEGLECGELTVYQELKGEFDEWAIIVQSSISPELCTEQTRVDVYNNVYDGVWSGLGLFAVDQDLGVGLTQKLSQLEQWGYIDGIHNIWLYPKNYVEIDGDWTGKVFFPVKGFKRQEVERLWHPYGMENIFQGYVPRNNKLYSYPFNMLYVTNNTGNTAMYRFERFWGNANTESPVFTYFGAMSPEASLKVVPLNYNGVDTNYDEGLTSGGFPTCAWDSDAYKIWMAQNKNAQNVAMIGGGVGVVSGVVSTLLGHPNGQGVSGAMSIANILAQRKDMQVQPPQSKGTYSASVNVAAGYPTFTFHYKSVCAEFAKIIDDYFDMYGYQVNRVGIPNRNARTNYTYVKTVGCAVGGNLCNEDRQKIASIFDTGITFWRDGDSIGNYGNNPCK